MGYAKVKEILCVKYLVQSLFCDDDSDENENNDDDINNDDDNNNSIVFLGPQFYKQNLCL